MEADKFDKVLLKLSFAKKVLLFCSFMIRLMFFVLKMSFSSFKTPNGYSLMTVGTQKLDFYRIERFFKAETDIF